ncbi:MAG TPA: hypothetical protein VMD27_11340 [Candidatus Aquilonibacter sp.]|nr:hypothetical protein [Candidatus Aquilonibacter sp.]
MKCDTTNAVLTFVLGVLVVLGALFAVRTIMRTREFRAVQEQAIVDQANMATLRMLFGEASEYAKTHPAITPILQAVTAKPTATR